MKMYKMKNKVPPIDTDIYITDSTGKRTMPDSISFTGKWKPHNLYNFMVAHGYLYWELKENN